MKSLALYIDKWYIIGAVCTDGNIRLVNLPNHEDRIWLYFFEDTDNDTISYGKGYKAQFFNNENHYYGDVFAQISSIDATFSLFKHSQPMSSIFKTAKIFDDLRNDFGVSSKEVIPTFLSFSTDVSADARLIFRRELSDANFKIEEHVARIEHLALEFAAKKMSYNEEGFYLILNACNENLHYSLYKRSENLFVRIQENKLVGMGTDLRGRCLIEYVIDQINRSERSLQTTDEREKEYLRASQFVDEWLMKLSNARTFIPVPLSGITLSNDPHKEFRLSVLSSEINQRTEVIVKNIVDNIVKFVKESNVSHEQINGIIFLGSTFTNNQFSNEFLNHYNLSEDRIISFKDSDLCSLVGIYNAIDRSQFSKESEAALKNEEDELNRKRIAEEAAEEERRAVEERNRIDTINREKAEADRKFIDAMDKGYESEREHDYDNMEDYFKIALSLQPESEEAMQKYNEALRMKAEASVRMKNYAERIQQAKAAFNNKDWETAKQKAEEALSANPDSKEALRIKSESILIIKNTKEFERYIDRADLFIAQKAYKEALQELNKAKLLDIDYASVQFREIKIQKEQENVLITINRLQDSIEADLQERDFDSAILTCNKLIELDITNKSKWSLKISDIRATQEKDRENQRKWDKLMQDIDSAQWNEQWESVVALCKDALSIKRDEAVQEKLRRAECRHKEVVNRKQFNKAIGTINELIVRAEFKEAEQLLRELDLNYHEPSEIQKIKDTRRLLFARETESEKAKIAPQSNRPTKKSDFFDEENESYRKRVVIEGFAAGKEKTELQKPKTPDEFDFDSDKSKNKSKELRQHKPKPSKDVFFDSFDSKSYKVSSHRKITNDDFEF